MKTKFFEGVTAERDYKRFISENYIIIEGLFRSNLPGTANSTVLLYYSD
jgi:hypothetical protein